MRKIIVSIATSADGSVARPVGSIDWLLRPDASGGGGDLRAFMRSIDAVIRGQATYDQVQGFSGSRATADPKRSARHLVFSTERPAHAIIASRFRPFPLRLKSSKKFSDGVVRLHYEGVGNGRRLGAKAAGKRSGRARTKASSRAHRRGSRR
jgi:hypothetical protein